MPSPEPPALENSALQPQVVMTGPKVLQTAEPSLEREWNIPCLTLVSYLFFAPFTVLCALHWTFGVLMWVCGLLSALLESILVVERRLDPFTDRRMEKASGCRLVARDVLQGIRVLSTTVLPILLASFHGASFVVEASWTHPRVSNCSVADLPALQEAGFTSFACTDGYVAVDMQLGVPAWGEWHKEKLKGVVNGDHKTRKRHFVETGLGRIHTLGTSEKSRFGFAAPIFRSQSAFEGGEAPVAWAVKAGSPVKRSVCDDNLGLPGTCGFFATTLQGHWQRFLLVPAWFGESWGFNITRFSLSEMQTAVAGLKLTFPEDNLEGPLSPTFVVAEDVRQYFGTAVPSLWVLVTLLVMGTVDRVVEVLDTPPSGAEEPTPSNVEYSKMMMEESQPPPEAPRMSVFGEFADFWNDALNSRNINDDLYDNASFQGTPRRPASSRLASSRLYTGRLPSARSGRYSEP